MIIIVIITVVAIVVVVIVAVVVNKALVVLAVVLVVVMVVVLVVVAVVLVLVAVIVDLIVIVVAIVTPRTIVIITMVVGADAANKGLSREDVRKCLRWHNCGARLILNRAWADSVWILRRACRSLMTMSDIITSITKKRRGNHRGGPVVIAHIFQTHGLEEGNRLFAVARFREELSFADTTNFCTGFVARHVCDR